MSKDKPQAAETTDQSTGDKIHEAELAFDRKRRSFGMVCGPICAILV